jgi:sugar O-acyltransferase (sialic acid O-acetyltransferase NeuD family)
MEKLVIIGTGGHAKSVFGLASSLDYNLSFFLDWTSDRSEFLGLKVKKTITDISNFEDYSYVIAIGDPTQRKIVQQKLTNLLPNYRFPSIAHKSAVVGQNSSVGYGTVIFPFSNIGPFAEVGNFCILNTGSNLEHESKLASFATLAPGATVGGNVHIGSGSWIGMNATVKHGITIGNDSIIGANSYVDKSFSSNIIAYGIPAKLVRIRSANEKFL